MYVLSTKFTRNPSCQQTFLYCARGEELVVSDTEHELLLKSILAEVACYEACYSLYFFFFFTVDCITSTMVSKIYDFRVVIRDICVSLLFRAEMRKSMGCNEAHKYICDTSMT